jgi:hypothetical protein
VRLPLADFAALTRDVIEDGGFKEFVKQAWPLVCPEELEWNWHLDVFCEELERIAYERKQDISNELAICVPPASTKSLIVSVLWRASPAGSCTQTGISAAGRWRSRETVTPTATG